MSVFVKLADRLNRVLGASWAAPIIVSRFGSGGGDYHSPTSLTATKSGSNSVTLSSVVPTITGAAEFRAVRAYGESGELLGEWYPSEQHRFVWDATGSILTVGGADWTAAASLDVEIHADHRAYSPTEDSYQIWVTNPEHAWTSSDKQTAATQGNGTSYYYWNVKNYKHFSIQVIDTPGAAGDNTYTFEATTQDDGTADSSCTYVARTSAWFGVASYTTDFMVERDTPMSLKYVRLKVVRANDGGANDGAWTVHQMMRY